MTDPETSPPATPVRAAIYARFFHADQIGGFSIQAQLRACREFAAREGWAAVWEYVDEARSAFRQPTPRLIPITDPELRACEGIVLAVCAFDVTRAP